MNPDALACDVQRTTGHPQRATREVPPCDVQRTGEVRRARFDAREIAGPLLPLLAATRRRAAADYLALTKPRLNFLAVATTLVGYCLGGGAVAFWPLFHAVFGTALVAAGASALNQVYERRTDALMRRTRMRPLPDGRLQPADAARFGWALSTLGLVQLAVGANPLAAFVALFTLVSYTAIYTPLKSRTSLATLVGAVPGALPPVIGWAAARGALSIEAWVLFAIVFLWQMPHFLAIAWLYRDDYARAGFPLLSVTQPDGRSTGRQALLYTAALVPVSLLPTVVGLAGTVYAVGAMLLGGGLLALGWSFAVTRSAPDARRLFTGSISYLPLLWILMVADRIAR